MDSSIVFFVIVHAVMVYQCLRFVRSRLRAIVLSVREGQNGKRGKRWLREVRVNSYIFFRQHVLNLEPELFRLCRLWGE